MKTTLNLVFACLFATLLACSDETIEVKTQGQETAISEGNTQSGKKSSNDARLQPGECRYRHPGNCTLYVSCRLGAGGFNQWGFDASKYEDKLSLINTSNGHIPRYGDVAIFNTGTTWGHMAFVEWRDPNTGQVHISETHFDGKDYNWRTSLDGNFPDLVGYHRP